MKPYLKIILALIISMLSSLSVASAENWSFAKPWGYYDKQQLKRGFEVYQQVCSACHSLRYLSVNELSKKLEIDKQKLASLVSENNVEDEQKVTMPSMMSPSVFPFFKATELNGMMVPDLSLMAKVRSNAIKGKWYESKLLGTSTGADYIFNFLTGFKEPDDDSTVPADNFYNPNFYSGNYTAMPDMLFDDIINYDDGAPQTKEQYAKDVSAFLAWVADPHKEQRQSLGFRVMLFIVILGIIIYLWRRRFDNLN